jgi:thiamine-monophosphate kinase
MNYDEAALLARIRSAFPAFQDGVGIGDDAAIFRNPAALAITTDMLIEDVDFTAAIPLSFVAVKSLAVNLSDLAAMGAKPEAFLLSLGLPEWALSSFDRFVESLSAEAARSGVALIGGDLSAAAKLTISITAIGSVPPSGALLRSGARPGDRIYLSRPIGGSAAGLSLLQRGWTVHESGVINPPAGTNFGYAQREFAAAAIRRQIAPMAEVELGQKLLASGEVTSCIDLSDGLSIDLKRLCDASSCGALIDRDRLPPFPDLIANAAALGIDVEAAVLHGGEEYALLFTSRLRESELSAKCGTPVMSIGRMRSGTGVFLETDGREAGLPASGFDHFRRDP